MYLLPNNPNIIIFFFFSYRIEWYDCTEKVKKMLLLIMLRTKTPLQLTAGGLHPINIENFGVVSLSSIPII